MKIATQHKALARLIGALLMGAALLAPSSAWSQPSREEEGREESESERPVESEENEGDEETPPQESDEHGEEELPEDAIPDAEPERDSRSFWMRDFAELVGNQIEIQIPSGYVPLLFRNDAPMQFHGASNQRVRFGPKLSDGLRIPNAIRDITGRITDRSGHFMIVLVPLSRVEPAIHNIDGGRIPYELPVFKRGEKAYRIINLESDGWDTIRVHLEGRRGADLAGDYVIADVDALLLRWP